MLITLLQEQAVAADLDPAPFAIGVASGDPAPESVVLWTRLVSDPIKGIGMADDAVPVAWEVATDEGFTHVVHRGEAIARVENGHSVHVIPRGLQPDRHYWYRFEAQGVRSRVGRTRTLPAPGMMPDRLRFATASCQAWRGGPFPAFRDMAEQELDFVVHLGDYIYETSKGTLEEFRRLYSLYKTSPELREVHARFPFITVWDDHEVLNNWHREDRRTPDGRPFDARRADAFQAYYEHLPMRIEPDGSSYDVYRRFDWGRLAQFSVLDTRQYRDAQLAGGLSQAPGEEIDDESRTMTGPEQERWLLEGLSTSKARWNVLAQQTIMARFDYDLGPGQAYNLDQWDGYPAARQRILDTIQRYRPSNPIVLAGDWHSHWVNDVLADFDDPDSEILASEFVGTSISSGIGWDAAVRAGLEANPHVRLYNGSYRGYVMCEVTPGRWESTLRIVLDPNKANSPAYTLAVFDVRDGVPGVRRLDGGDGLAGTITGGGKSLGNAEILVRGGGGDVVVRNWTDPRGEFTTFVPPGSYTVEAHAVGFASDSRQVTVPKWSGVTADFALKQVTGAFAGKRRRVPGSLSQGGPDDVVLGNALVAVTVSDAFEDGQLPNATRGKPFDMAARGRLDQIDWFNLPYVAARQPGGTNAWQEGLVRADAVDIVQAGSARAVVRTTGKALDVPGVAVETTYTLLPDQSYVDVVSVFTATAPATVWVGDGIDHDGAGQRSGVGGTGTISTPYGSPAAYQPTTPWIGMTGSDAQTYGIVYDDADFTAYGNGNWIQSQREVVLEAGTPVTLRRRLVAIVNDGEAWAPLDALAG